MLIIDFKTDLWLTKLSGDTAAVLKTWTLLQYQGVCCIVYYLGQFILQLTGHFVDMWT